MKDHSTGSWRGWCGCLFIAAALVAPVAAQRTDFTFHIHVDPIHGNDQAAFRGNPTVQTQGASGTRWDLWFPGAAPVLAKNQFNLPLGIHPAQPATRIQGDLIQAPLPFKTITRGEGALAYILNHIFNNSPTPYLPVTITGNKRITRIIIHCLPGLYGPNPTNATDPDSGLRWNDEDFPVRMMHGVCLQGTSAMDTIFDARNRVPTQQRFTGDNAVIAFVPAPIGTTLPPSFYSDTFVDGVTIRNNTQLFPIASVPGVPGNWGNGSGVGVYIGGEYSNQSFSPIVSNCFIVNTVVGVAIESRWDDTTVPATSVLPNARPLIVNNTIHPWKTVPATDYSYAIWNGNRYPTGNFLPGLPVLGSFNIGTAQPIILNNILDAFGPQVTVLPPPPPPTIAPAPQVGPYAMAGVHWDDCRLSSYIDMAGGVVPTTYNPNAYQLGTLGGAQTVWGEVFTGPALPGSTAYRYFVGAGATPVWPVPAVLDSVAVVFVDALTGFQINVPARPASVPGPQPYVPGVDIAPYTDPSSSVNVLYIRDVFRNYIDAPVGAPFRCQHDYRLAPTVRTAQGVAGTNPLIGAGLNESPDGSPNAAGNVILGHNYFGKPTFTFPALQSPLDFPTASEHHWDWDADGFGNPRIGTNILFAGAGNALGDIDIGADEVGDVVVSGYLNSTRIFSQDPIVGAGPVTFTRAATEHFYFGLAGTSFPTRPRLTAFLGQVEPWYRHIESFGLAAQDKVLPSFGWQHAGGTLPAPQDGLMATPEWTQANFGSGAPYRWANRILLAHNPGIPRNQYCDFATLLQPDPKPWGIMFGKRVSCCAGRLVRREHLVQQ